ncbi:MAG TPA: DUF4838 domain-containing protein [Tepidisphaeraceae bacterium]|jgi:hypothetical protein|nr:DUF4838 domain-containing protein [Tepidisphaeraceae bacterium]
MKLSLITLCFSFLILSTLRAATLPITTDGHSPYHILTPIHPSPEIQTAAAELQHFLLQITGVTLPISPESDHDTSPAFLLGPCHQSIAAGLTTRAASLKEDGVLIQSLGPNIALLGQNPRGNLYSVYVFLEKYLNVRFLAWDCTIVPHQSDLSLPPLDYAYASPFMYRETYYFDSFPKQIAARQRLNGPGSTCDATTGGKFEFFPFVHSSSQLIPPDTYFKTHPEYFALNNGKRVGQTVNSQLCFSNPDVLRLAKQKVFQWITDHPTATIIDISQNDGIGACECDNCKAIVTAEGGAQSGPILRFVNAIADEVAAKYPDKWVETLAYSYSVQPPTLTKPRPNVIIRLCHVGDYFRGFEQAPLGSQFALWIDQWRKLTSRIFIWHYASNFGHYLAPNQNLAGLAKDLKFYASHGVNGVMVQADYQSPGGELAELRQYLSAQLLWNPSQDPLQIRNDFCQGYYGPASPDVLDFLHLEDELSADPSLHAFGAWDPQTTVPPAFLTQSLTILNRALARAPDPTIHNRIEKLLLPFWYMQLTYPAKYNFSPKDAPALLQQTQQVLTTNHITHIREGPESTQQWLTQMNTQFPKPH